MGKTVNRTDPYGVVWRDGEPLDRRTLSALERAEKKARIRVRVVQGSYQAQYGGGAAASAHTHDRGGVIDISVAGMTRRQRIRFIRSLKRRGFFVWFRGAPLWAGNEHIHAGMRWHRNLHPEALAQEADYDRRLNGLMSRLRDGTWRPLVSRHWSHRQGKIVLERPGAKRPPLWAWPKP